MAIAAVVAWRRFARRSGASETSRTQPLLNPVHNHIGHVMTTWKDTPGSQGFLPTAIADAKVAATHAGYMQKASDNLDSLKLHAGHVLNALDPSIEAKGPGSGYGVKKGRRGRVAAHRARREVGRRVQGCADARRARDRVARRCDGSGRMRRLRPRRRSARRHQPLPAAPSSTELIAQTNNINNGLDANKDGSIGWQTGEGGLAQANQHMMLMMKGEGL